MNEIESRLAQMEDEVYARLRASTARMDETVAKLEPITRAAAKQAQIDAVQAMGKVVKDKKPARLSGTVNASLTGAIAAVYAAWELFPGAMVTGEWDTFGAAAGAAVTALVSIYRRWKVGDLEVFK